MREISRVAFASILTRMSRESLVRVYMEIIGFVVSLHHDDESCRALRNVDLSRLRTKEKPAARYS